MRAPRPMDISAANPTPMAASRGRRPILRMRSSALSDPSRRISSPHPELVEGRGEEMLLRMRYSVPADPARHSERRRRLLYGRRKGPKLSAHQLHLRETLLPRLTLHIQNG